MTNLLYNLINSLEQVATWLALILTAVFIVKLIPSRIGKGFAAGALFLATYFILL